jgi:hypothetical protein
MTALLQREGTFAEMDLHRDFPATVPVGKMNETAHLWGRAPRERRDRV